MMPGWVKPRKEPERGPPTEHQKRIGEAGKAIKAECTGKKGTEFRQCRRDVLRRVFHPKDEPTGR